MPKVARDGKIVAVEPIQLSDACKNDLINTETSKVLATVDADGVAHCAPKELVELLADDYAGCIAVMEMVEGSQTSRNMLRSYEQKQNVAILVTNQKTGNSFLVKGLIYRFIYDGPLWLRFLAKAWSARPDSEPSGVWVIVPTEERNQDFAKRMSEEDTRLLPPSSLWRRFRDAGYAKRYG